VLVDRAPRDLDLDDATKVRREGDRVTAIGKGLEPWDAIDAGCFVLTPAVFDALRRVPASEPRSVSSGMRQLVAQGALGAVEIVDTPWVDVDTPADLALADDFDARVIEARREQDDRSGELTRKFDQRRRQFYASVAPILVTFMDRYAAKAIFDENSVLLADQSINITEEVIAEIDVRLTPEAPATPAAPVDEPAAPDQD
jgi:hypothetical protein